MLLAQHRNRLIIDVVLIFLSIVLTVLAIHFFPVSNFLHGLLLLHPWLACLVAGFFLVSIFTAVPATAAVLYLSLHLPIFVVVTLGAVGSMLGDFLMFSFFRSALLDDVKVLIAAAKERPLWRYFATSAGQAVLAMVGIIFWLLPLPDEIALAVLGLSKTRKPLFLLLSFSINFLTMLGIVIIARSIF